MESSSPTRILVVDDDACVLTALKHYFSVAKDIEIVAEAENGAVALEQIERLGGDLDLVLADIHMPEVGGIELLRTLQSQNNPPVFVAMTSMDTDETMLEILTSGGAGYIIKSACPVQFIQAVRDAMNGGTAVSPECLSRLVDFIPERSGGGAAVQAGKSASPNKQEQPGAAPDPESIPEGERTTLQLLVQGHSNAEIAKEALYAESTVKKHVSSLMKRFGVDSRLRLAISAIRAGY